MEVKKQPGKDTAALRRNSDLTGEREIGKRAAVWLPAAEGHQMAQNAQKHTNTHTEYVCWQH